MSITLSRSAGLESISVESFTSVDGQGKPTYASAVVIQGRVVREDTKDANSNVRMGSGQEVKTIATIWVNGTVVLLPKIDDRVTLADGLVGIVAEKKDGKKLRGALDHVRYRLRER